MTVLAFTTRRLQSLATLAAACSFGLSADAQVAVTTPQTAQQTAPAAAYTAPAVTGYAQHPMQTAPTGQPAYGQPAYGQPAYGQPAYGQPAYGQPAPAVVAYGQPVYQQPAYQPPAYHVAQATPPSPSPSSDAGAKPADDAKANSSWGDYSYSGDQCGSTCTDDCGAGVCESGACGSTCDLGSGIGKNRGRQWFGGIYYIMLDRVYGDRNQVGYITDTTGFTPGDDYYYQPTDTGFFSDSADLDPLHGGEIRFGSTFGPCDPCGSPRFAWELAYWALDDSEARGLLELSAPVSSTNADRMYGAVDYSGLRYDFDGAGGNPDRPMNDYNDYGVPADGDVTANDIRVVALRVRRKFQAQNLELNFWRFGTPECSSCRVGSIAGGLANIGRGPNCGDGACGSACQPARPPRQFVINGLLGLRYFRFDDDLGFDTQFVRVDGAGDPLAGEGNAYSGSFPLSDPHNIVHDIETDNELVGFQLGCSMNWLIGCKWNLFADSNFGIYGNNIEVYQRVVGGSGVLTYDGGGDVVSRSSETELAFLGELRAGVAYQVTCNCRLTAAYRFIGAGGVALADSQIPDAGFANPGVVGYVDTDDSLILHGLQLGSEFSF